ncbi:DUF3048 domain-containing protein [Pontibacillus marinus]|uniref:Lipoprotein YerB n=1 Tax=Pontibacillus marinus BH030004 = DSM 16465 TaxID=1385511 RepID=A0A0A5G6E0_9BACI|nr:DUF3048 domain-containing protein [Pontibacillus marinus]KGX88691.1 hypothetical protein N783_07340 [Pontibacillus marinus BH030004 = DSM 16465]
MQKRWMLLLAMVTILVLAACSEQSSKENEESSQKDNNEKQEQNQEKEDPVEVVDKDEQENKEEKEEKKEPEFAHIYPLTGKGTDEPVNHRIISVMVNNHSKARPQTGLNQADMVYEILAEGPITRFLAFYHTEKPPLVGPVRSAREYYFRIAKGYNALYLYHGAAQYIEDKLKAGYIDHINGMYYDNDRHLFKRESFRYAPHNSYLMIRNVYDVAKQKGYEVEKEHKPLPFLNDEQIKNISGNEATTINITYSDSPRETVKFEYNQDTQKYTRFNDGSKTADLNSKEPTTVDNVFIVETGHQVIDSKLRRAIDTESGGNGYLIQKGKVQQVSWKNVDGRIIPFKDGKKLGFVPGKTWVNIVPESPGIQQSVTFTSPQ